ncbi:arsenate reductase family protein [Chryseobacterium suipulveris]|uniref:Arsenate reductase family protein n=1 Tax=Chryseobacterium suipulveris TaxID=2929800 RepID=A0ABY4BQN1_9FLAO|nr:arsenate reductase family protein [Chryseobacterium suipulveris]UOE40076.1 arsenate reductase family protein [Chryseobacterium suipulveris]
MIKVLHNNSCSKSRGILEYLDENGVPFEVIDFVNDPLSVNELNAVLKKLNMGVHEIIRKNETLYKEKFADQNFSDEEWVKILTENPELIQRPILIKSSVAMIGRPLENVKYFIEK